MRFMTEQYAEGLPLGCMLGYVMDGDLPFALAQVTSAIDSHKTPLGSINSASSCKAILGIERFSTLHQRANKSIIELRHALMPFSNPQGSGATLPQTKAPATMYDGQAVWKGK